MKIDGCECKYLANICSDGRLYYGGWTNVQCIPNPLPDNMVALDSFPTDETAKDGGSDYKWDGEKLIYDPVPEEERERKRREIYLEKTGLTPEQYAAKYGSGGDA